MTRSKKTAPRKLGRPTESGSLRSILSLVQSWAGYEGTTLDQIREWKAKDYDFTNAESLTGCLQSQQRLPDNLALEPDEVRKQTAVEKLLKLRAERIAKDRDNAVKAGELISLAEYMEINARVDADICKALDDLPIDFAPRVFGVKTIAEITVKLREGVDAIKAALNAPIRNPSPPPV